MEAVLVLGGGLTAWLCAFVLTWPDRSSAIRLFEAGGLARHVVRLCEKAAAMPIIDALMLSRSWMHVAEEVSKRAADRGLLLSLRVAAAALAVTATLFGIAMAWVAWSPLGFLVGVVGFIAAMSATSAAIVRKRRLGLAQEMPGIFRTLAVALGSGQTMSQAIEHVGARGHGYASESFAKAALMLRCGSSVEEALETIEHDLAAPGVGMLTTALRVSHTTGSPLKDLFMKSARLVERTSEFERLLSVKTAQVRLSVKIVCMLPVALVALLSVISPDFRAGLATPAGMASVCVAALMDTVALLIVRRLVREVI